MEREEFRKRIEELHANPPAHCDWRSFLKITQGDLAPEQSDALDAYFAKFLPMADRCPGCQKKLPEGVVDAFLAGLTNKTSLEWGLAHGEAFCTAWWIPVSGLSP